MSLTAEERETIVTWDCSTDEMRVYTCDPNLMRRLDKYPAAYRLIKSDMKDGRPIAKTYAAKKKLCSLRSKQNVRNMTDEQKAAGAERLRAHRQAQNN